MAVRIPHEVRALLGELAARLRERFGDRLVRLTLFGSYARGEADPIESDVDVLVVVRDMTLEERRLIVQTAVEIGCRHEFQLSALCLTAERFDKLVQDERLLAREIERDGISL
jgi:predicted nucleotidyltransferase